MILFTPSTHRAADTFSLAATVNVSDFVKVLMTSFQISLGFRGFWRLILCLAILNNFIFSFSC